MRYALLGHDTLADYVEDEGVVFCLLCGADAAGEATTVEEVLEDFPLMPPYLVGWLRLVEEAVGPESLTIPPEVVDTLDRQYGILLGSRDPIVRYDDCHQHDHPADWLIQVQGELPEGARPIGLMEAYGRMRERYSQVESERERRGEVPAFPLELTEQHYTPSTPPPIERLQIVPVRPPAPAPPEPAPPTSRATLLWSLAGKRGG